MTNISQAYLSVVEDVPKTLESAERFNTLLKAIQHAIPCDAIALMRLERERLIPVASVGLGPGCQARRFEVSQQPRLAHILSCRNLVRFEADSNLPDPFDGLFGEGDGKLTAHDCMGTSIYIEDRPWGVLTFDAVTPGQFDHIDPEQVQTAVTFTRAVITAVDRIHHLEEKLRHGHQVTAEINRDLSAHSIIGDSDVIRTLNNDIKTVAKAPLSVLIEGETGVGKELVARQLHLNSNRFDQPLVHVNCAALPEQLAEAELFGHTKGAFTGAGEARAGRIELADGGTLFLDEVGELPLTLQAKLLRFLQEGEIQRPGSDTPVQVDVRVITATNRALAKEVSEGRFRADLYHRLSVFPIHVPPLRERGRDILLLAEYFLERDQFRLQVDKLVLSQSAKKQLLQYDWPGNVRELEHLLSRAALKASQLQVKQGILRIMPDNLGLNSFSTQSASTTQTPMTTVRPLRDAVDQFQQQLIEDALIAHNGNIAAAARSLEINRSNLSRLMKRLGINS